MENSKKLQVCVTSADTAQPLEKATVLITNCNNFKKYDLLSIQLTDVNGEIRPICLPESQNPSTIQIWVEHEDYALLRIDGITVQEGEQTLLQVQLPALCTGQSSLQQRENKPTVRQKR